MWESVPEACRGGLLLGVGGTVGIGRTAMNNYHQKKSGSNLLKPIFLKGVSSTLDEATGQVQLIPDVAFIRPHEGYAGHPGDSSLSSYEDFVVRIANAVISQPELFRTTAIVVTTDEGGGYYDSGYIQPLDFFGDGTRIPLLVISPWVEAGTVDHTYYDHASILKFIEANWGLTPLSDRSRDRLPNPVASASNPYVPVNGPALGDLMALFDFHHLRSQAPLIIPVGI